MLEQESEQETIFLEQEWSRSQKIQTPITSDFNFNINFIIHLSFTFLVKFLQFIYFVVQLPIR